MTGFLPATTAGRIDLVWPPAWKSWGGPFNGQEKRREIVCELACAIHVDLVVETGTYRGTSSRFLAEIFAVPVETVEYSPRFYAFSKARFALKREISVTRGESPAFLQGLARTTQDKTIFFYLDAHWEENLPLHDELEVISCNWMNAAVMIDDFAVPGDSGYSYDDYGPGKALVEDYLPPMPGWALLYPTAQSSEETGAKRGCAVLLSPSLTHLQFAALASRRSTEPG